MAGAMIYSVAHIIHHLHCRIRDACWAKCIPKVKDPDLVSRTTFGYETTVI